MITPNLTIRVFTSLSSGFLLLLAFGSFDDQQIKIVVWPWLPLSVLFIPINVQLALLYVHTRSDHSVKDALVAHKVSLRIFLFALVAQDAHDVQFNYADAFKGAVCV